MKKLFLLTALLMMQYVFTQNTKPTERQKKQINEIFDPEYVIETSNIISIYKEQDSVISVRDIQIKELNRKIQSLKNEYTKTLLSIAKENKTVEVSAKEVDKISDTELKKQKFKWQGIHSYIGTETPKFNLGKTIINIELMYELNMVEFGIKGELRPNQDNQYNSNILVKLRYKFF